MRVLLRRARHLDPRSGLPSRSLRRPGRCLRRRVTELPPPCHRQWCTCVMQPGVRLRELSKHKQACILAQLSHKLSEQGLQRSSRSTTIHAGTPQLPRQLAVCAGHTAGTSYSSAAYRRLCPRTTCDARRQRRRRRRATTRSSSATWRRRSAATRTRCAWRRGRPCCSPTGARGLPSQTVAKSKSPAEVVGAATHPLHYGSALAACAVRHSVDKKFANRPTIALCTLLPLISASLAHICRQCLWTDCCI